MTNLMGGSRRLGEPRLLYVAHPVAGDLVGNLERARRWFTWLHSAFPADSFVAPWILLIELSITRDHIPTERARGMLHNERSLERCDGIVLVGGRLSEGMRHELAHAKARGLQVLDLLGLGAEPPSGMEAA